jgi:4-amino-4-deoxy-L-arabinose transferase-like glycosyltransferase
VFPDSESYILASENLYYLHKADIIRPSLIAAINGFPLLFGYSIDSLFFWNTVINLIFWLAIVLLIYQMALQFVSQKIAFLLALLYLFSVGSLVLIFQVLSETPFTFLLLLSLHFFQKYFNNNQVKHVSFGFSLLIISILIKPMSFGLGIILFVFFFYKLKKIFLDKWSLPIYVSILLVFFHMCTMKKNYGNFTISYIDTYTYYNYLGTRADCLKNNTEFVQCNNYRYQYFNTLSLSEGKKEAFRDMKKQITSNTINFVKAYFINIYFNSYRGSGYFYEFKNVNKTSYFEFVKIIFRGISKLQNIFYTMIGVFLAFNFLKKNRRELNFIKVVSFCIMYIFLMSGISSDQGDRFHIVFYPFVIILIAKFINDKSSIKRFSAPLQK